MSDIPISITEAGVQPTDPKVLLSNLIKLVSKEVPGYTANLPAGLITDLASTATGALALIDQARVDLINSVSPYAANIPLLKKLGNIYGVQQGQESNTSVYVTFTGLPGFFISKGFVVSDGNNQYQVTADTVIPTSGQTPPVYCLAKNSGTWAVPAGTVTQIITSVPVGQTLTCTNLTAGLPGEGEQSLADYRAQVMRAGMFAVQGTPDCIRAALEKVKGVQGNLVSIHQPTLGKWVITVGGGDPLEVAAAIYQAVPDISTLTRDVTDSAGNPVSGKTVDILVYPDTYQIPFVIPASQDVSVTVTWNTTATSFIDENGVVSATQQPISDYVNAIAIGRPINTLEIQQIFAQHTATLIPPGLLSQVDVRVAINRVTVVPSEETSLIYGDVYSYFSSTASTITVKKFGS